MVWGNFSLKDGHAPKHAHIRGILWLAAFFLMLIVFWVTIEGIVLIRGPQRDIEGISDILPGIIPAIGFLWSLMLAVFVIMTNSLVEGLKNGKGKNGEKSV